MANVDLFFLIYNLHGYSQILDTLMIFWAEYLIYITSLAVLLLAAAGSKERRSLLLVIISGVISLLLIKIIHSFYFEPRPFITYHFTPLIFHDQDPSFPSSHATYMAVMAFSYFFTKSKYGWIFLVSLLWVGFSRIYVGVHYPLDIVGGIVTGIISVAIGGEILKHILKRVSRFEWSNYL